MSKRGISTQQARLDNFNAFDLYIKCLVQTKSDWPRNGQTGDISILAIESAMKRLGNSFSRKYLVIPKTNRKDLFTERFLRGKEEVRLAFENNEVDPIPLNQGAKKSSAAHQNKRPPSSAKGIRENPLSTSRIGKIFGVEIATSTYEAEIAMLNKQLAQYDLINTIATSTGRFIVPILIPRLPPKQEKIK